MDNINKCEYKIKEKHKKQFEIALKKVHHLKNAKIMKKKKDEYYIYNIESNPMYDYYNMMTPKKQRKEKEKENKHQNYQKAILKLISLKDNDYGSAFGVKVGGKKTDKLEDIYSILDNNVRILKYYHNKYMDCISAFIDHNVGIFSVDIYKDRIIEGLILNFSMFEGFYDKTKSSDTTKKFIKGLNKEYKKWLNSNFKGNLLQ